MNLINQFYSHLAILSSIYLLVRLVIGVTRLISLKNQEIKSSNESILSVCLFTLMSYSLGVYQNFDGFFHGLISVLMIVFSTCSILVAFYPSWILYGPRAKSKIPTSNIVNFNINNSSSEVINRFVGGLISIPIRLVVVGLFASIYYYQGVYDLALDFISK